MFKSQRRSYRQELWENSLLFPQSRKLISSFSHAFFVFFFNLFTRFSAHKIFESVREKREEQRERCVGFFPAELFFNLPATLKMLYNFSVALLSSLFAAYLSCQFQPFFCRIDRSYEFSSTMLFSRWVPVEREDVASRYRVPKEPCTARTKGRFLWSSKILTTSWNACYSVNSYDLFVWGLKTPKSVSERMFRNCLFSYDRQKLMLPQ